MCSFHASDIKIPRESSGLRTQLLGGSDRDHVEERLLDADAWQLSTKSKWELRSMFRGQRSLLCSCSVSHTLKFLCEEGRDDSISSNGADSSPAESSDNFVNVPKTEVGPFSETCINCNFCFIHCRG